MTHCKSMGKCDQGCLHGQNETVSSGEWCFTSTYSCGQQKPFQKNDVNAKQEENYTAILIFKLIFFIVSYNLFHYLVLCVSTICTDNCFNASWLVEYEFLAIIIWDAMDLNVLNSFDKRFGTGCQPYFSNAPIHFQ